MSEFHFLRPYWLLVFLPTIFILFGLARLQVQQSGWQQWVPKHLLQHIVITPSKQKNYYLSMLGVVWFLAIIALAGPTLEKRPQPVYQVDLGKVIVFDLSLSMFASDLIPNRLTKARFKALDLLEKIKESHIGLIAYTDDAFVLSPLTSDRKNLTNLIPILSPEIMPVQGSNPIVALLKAHELLQSAGYQRGEIFLITDEIDQQDTQLVQEFIQNNDHRLSILGVGTAQGAPIVLPDGEFLKTANGNIIVPTINHQQLQQLARSTGGGYSPITNNDQDLDHLLQTLSLRQSQEAERQNGEELQGDKWEELGPYLVLLILPFALYSFRRGVIALWIALLFPHYSSQADVWTDLWQTKDQQGQEAYNIEKYEQAAELFIDPMWQGTSHYRQGDYESAVKAFKQQDTAEAWYNQGNSLAKLQQYEEAIVAYEETLTKQPDHKDAAHNLEEIKKLLEQQNQQNQQNQQDESQDSDQQSGDSSDNSQQNQSENSEGGESEQQSEEQQNNEQQNQEQQESQQQQGQNQQQQENSDAEPEQDQEQNTPEEQEQEPSQEQQAQAGLQPSEQELQNMEQTQEIQQLLRKVADDPSLLLRNKMRLEYQKRRHEQQDGVSKKW